MEPMLILLLYMLFHSVIMCLSALVRSLVLHTVVYRAVSMYTIPCIFTSIWDPAYQFQSTGRNLYLTLIHTVAYLLRHIPNIAEGSGPGSEESELMISVVRCT